MVRWLHCCVAILPVLIFNAVIPASAQKKLQPVSYTELSGWRDDNHGDALLAFQRSCNEILGQAHGFKRQALYAGSIDDWRTLCKSALNATRAQARDFFEQNFTPVRVIDPDRPQGLFTGYYEPEAQGALEPSKEYQVPIYAKPPDLIAFDAAAEAQTGLKYGRKVSGTPRAYFTREQIEKGALRDQKLEIVWLKSWADAFFIHVQGSGRVRLPDGSAIRLAYAAKTGLPYTGIGGVLVKRGVLTPETNSMQAIRNWIQKNPEAARELMWENQSFVFFRQIEITDETLGALGAQQVNLTPLRSLAVDRSIWGFGTPIWLTTTTPPESPGGERDFNHLMIAQDTGTAIKGFARGDVYWGWGADAAQIAGHMKSPGTMTALLPNAVAKSLLAQQ
jgi:membrane-bound lytic murein transglycosylase A